MMRLTDDPSALGPLWPPGLATRAVSARKASNLAFALRALPPDRQADALVFYDFCRIVDDIADEPGIADSARREALDAWRSAVRGANDSPALPEPLRAVVDRHAIDPELLDAILLGVIQDIDPVDFQTFEDLRQYCWRVAAAVGLVSLRIFGLPAPEGDRFANALGLALQLTNILRDVSEDAQRGRVYLPLDVLNAAGVSRESVLAGRMTAGLCRAMKSLAETAHGYFAEAVAERPTGRDRELRAADLMARIYFGVLRKIERRGFDVFSRRVRLSAAEKLWLLATSGHRRLAVRRH